MGSAKSCQFWGLLWGLILCPFWGPSRSGPEAWGDTPKLRALRSRPKARGPKFGTRSLGPILQFTSKVRIRGLRRTVKVGAGTSLQTSPNPHSTTPLRNLALEPRSGTSPNHFRNLLHGPLRSTPGNNSGIVPEPCSGSAPSLATSPEPYSETSLRNLSRRLPAPEPHSGTALWNIPPNPFRNLSRGTSPETLLNLAEPRSGTTPEPIKNLAPEHLRNVAPEARSGTSPKLAPEPRTLPGTSPKPCSRRSRTSSGTSPKLSADPLRKLFGTRSGTSRSDLLHYSSGTTPEPVPDLAPERSGTSLEPAPEPAPWGPLRSAPLAPEPLRCPTPSSGTTPHQNLSGTSPEPRSGTSPEPRSRTSPEPCSGTSPGPAPWAAPICSEA